METLSWHQSKIVNKAESLKSWLVQGDPRLLPKVSWDRLQQARDPHKDKRIG